MARAYIIPAQAERTRYKIFSLMKYIDSGGLTIDVSVCDLVDGQYLLDAKEPVMVYTIDGEAWAELVGTTGVYNEDDIWLIIDKIDAGSLNVSLAPYVKRRTIETFRVG